MDERGAKYDDCLEWTLMGYHHHFNRKTVEHWPSLKIETTTSALLTSNKPPQPSLGWRSILWVMSSYAASSGKRSPLENSLDPLAICSTSKHPRPLKFSKFLGHIDYPESFADHFFLLKIHIFEVVFPLISLPECTARTYLLEANPRFGFGLYGA